MVAEGVSLGMEIMLMGFIFCVCVLLCHIKSAVCSANLS